MPIEETNIGETMAFRDFQRCSECRALNEPRALFCSRCGASLYGPVHGGVMRKRRRATAAGAAFGFAMLLLLAAAIFLLAIVVNRALTTTEPVDVFTGQVGTSATITTAPPATSANGGGNPNPPAGGDAAAQIRPTACSASSTLKSTSTNSYGATNLLDGDLTTAWNEGAEGNGLDEWVQFDFSQEIVLARIEIANGYQKDDDRYFGNPRVKSLKVEYSNGTTQLVDLLDDKKIQTITPTRQPITSVRLVILSVYDGAEWDDTALSEVRFYEAVD